MREGVCEGVCVVCEWCVCEGVCEGVCVVCEWCVRVCEGVWCM